jgi:hypothetical protein
MVFVAAGSAQQKAFAVELEGAVLDPLGVTNAEGLTNRIFRSGPLMQDYAALVEMRA